MYQRAIICLILFLNYSIGYGNSWDQAQLTKKANLTLYWYTSDPFIYPNPNQNLTGLEYEIINSFKDFLQRRYSINLELRWSETKSFYNIIEKVQHSSEACFGVSAFSITKERQKIVRYTNSYLPDITVLISSKGTPIVHSYEEFDKLVTNLEAITIKGTIYEPLLDQLQSQLNNPFKVNYIGSDQNVLDIISEAGNRFGFIDLPIYLMTIKQGSELTRQNFFTVKGMGYGFIMPQNSDWNIPFNEFLADPVYKREVAQIISNYLGTELYEIIDNLFEGEPLGTSILTKEKEIQLALIQNANLRLEEEREFKRLLIFGIVVSILFLNAVQDD
ncbi:MAG: transporter substrate-binding domain-containing protein, partial [Cyclobacteriaceae bacterium]